MGIIIFLCAILSLTAVESLPKKLLRVPKIYNALITTNEKLLPSEAYPASTGTVFQPIGLTGEPILLNPEAFARNQPDGEEEGQGEEPRPFSLNPDGEKKPPQPLTFYPRYNVYHQYNPFYPYSSYEIQQPILYSFGDGAKEASAPGSPPAPAEPELQSQLPPEPQTQAPPAPTYVKNNNNPDIPDVIPPPPPVGAPRPEPVDDEPDANRDDNDPR